MDPAGGDLIFAVLAPLRSLRLRPELPPEVEPKGDIRFGSDRAPAFASERLILDTAASFYECHFLRSAARVRGGGRRWFRDAIRSGQQGWLPNEGVPWVARFLISLLFERD